MNFQVIDSGWGELLDNALQADCSSVRIVCPFIKLGAARNLLTRGKPGTIKVITRFNLDDFASGVSDTSALRLLLRAGAEIRGIMNLHAKLYLIGCGHVILTSANLTNGALRRNHELGIDAEDPEIFSRCASYFDGLWRRGGRNLVPSLLNTWDIKIGGYRRQMAGVKLPSGLGDEGSDAGLPAGPAVVTNSHGKSGQAFVKFFGESNNRAPWSLSILDELARSGSHWACPYPKGKRPRKVEDGATIFMGRMVQNPNDILIYGRATGTSHVPGRDDATPAEIKRRPWKAKWPHYVRVDDGEFIAGTLTNCVSLYDMMDALGSDSFVSTQENARQGLGNTNPRRAYLQQAAVHLTDKSFQWLTRKLGQAFVEHGKISSSELAQLDWPNVDWAKYGSSR
jgi:hypothetical protein